MTADKKPALLAVVIRASKHQWFVACVDTDSTVIPLVRSNVGALDAYLGQAEDEQLSFLRHKLSGAMQRGCDRLWALDRKASRIVLIVDDEFPGASRDLTQRLADHFHVWMSRPPITCYRGHGVSTIEDLPSLQCLVGVLDGEQAGSLQAALGELSTRLDSQDDWEVIGTS